MSTLTDGLTRYVATIDFDTIIGRSDVHEDELAGDIMTLLHKKYKQTAYVHVVERTEVETDQ